MKLDLKMDIGAMLKGRGTGAKDKGPNPYSSTIASAVLVVLVAAVFFNFLYLPLKKGNSEMVLKLDGLKKAREEIQLINAGIANYRRKVDKLQAQYELLPNQFLTNQTLEDLYRQIGVIADNHHLKIVNLDKGEEEPVYKQSASGGTPSGNAPAGQMQVAYHKLPISYTITGDFLNFYKLMRDFSSIKSAVNIDKLNIRLLDDKEVSGNVKVIFRFTVYKMSV